MNRKKSQTDFKKKLKFSSLVYEHGIYISNVTRTRSNQLFRGLSSFFSPTVIWRFVGMQFNRCIESYVCRGAFWQASGVSKDSEISVV